jgi:hypothetical protein
MQAREANVGKYLAAAAPTSRGVLFVCTAQFVAAGAHVWVGAPRARSSGRHRRWR